MKFVHSLGGRIFGIFVAATLPLTILLLILNFYAMRVVREQVSISTSDLLGVYADQIENTAMEMTSYLSRMALESEDIAQMGMLSDDTNAYLVTKERVLNRLNSDLNLYVGVDALFIYDKEKKDIGLVSGAPSYQNAYNTAWEYLQVFEAENGAQNMQWNLMKRDRRYYLVNVFDGRMGVYVGALMDVQVILEPLNSINLGETGHVLLYSDEGNFYMSKDIGVEVLFYEEAKAQLSDTDYDVVKNGSTRFLCIKSELEELNFSLLTFIEEDGVLMQLPTFQIFLYVILVIIFVLFAVLLAVSERTIIRPTRKMIESLEQQDSEAPKPIGEDYSIRELNELSGTVNQFIQEIDTLKTTVLEEKVRAQQAEMKHLQSQINPHFYINTLNMIYSLVAMDDKFTAQKLVLHLGNYLKFMMRNNRTEVTLSEELGHIENYLEIQIVRFPEEISYSFEISEELREMMLPPLSVQPFVENCVIHAMDKKGEAFHIRIEGRIAEEGGQKLAEISILDNGRGIPPETMETLNHVDEADDSFVDRHIGVWNVLRRLKIEFGDRAKVIFSENSPKGTAVTLQLPMDGAKSGKEQAEDV